jgi:hypothetical protein
VGHKFEICRRSPFVRLADGMLYKFDQSDYPYRQRPPLPEAERVSAIHYQ